MAENFSENDEDYADTSILEALEVRSGPDGCIINTTDGGVTPVYAPQPAIVLQLNDGSNLLLPIIVLELPSTMLLEAVRNVQIMRPTVYQVMSKILEVSGYRAKLVRVTKRVNETYFARAYLVKDGDDSEPPVSLDIRPSDAINLAVRCKIPIQVCRMFPFSHLRFNQNLNLLMRDGMHTNTHLS
jgi:bifunctional DNase/RNase